MDPVPNIPQINPQPQAPVIPEPEGGGGFKKWLVIVFAILFVIVASEVGYLAYNSYSLKNQAEEPPPSPVFVPPSPLPMVDKELFLNKSERLLDLIKTFEGKTDLVHEVNFSAIIGGYFAEAGFEEYERGGIRYPYRINLRNNQYEYTIIRFTEEEWAGAKAIDLGYPETHEIDITQVEPGNFVVVKLKTDLLDGANKDQIIFEVY